MDETTITPDRGAMNRTPTSACIILAGGRSRRMGTDKALLPLPGVAGQTGQTRQTFVGQLVATLSQVSDGLALVARDEQQTSLLAQAVPTARIVTDIVPDYGPLMGLYTGLSAIQAEKALVVAVDMPFVQAPLATLLLTRASTSALLVPVVDDVPQVLCAVYPRSMLPLIESCIVRQRRDPRALLSVAPVDYIQEAQLREVDPQLRSFMNMNTPDDLRGA